MIQIVSCGMMLIILFAVFYFWSNIPQKIFGITWKTISEKIIYGFFTYFICFQIVAMPLVWLKRTVTEVSILWGLIVLAVTSILIGTKGKNLKRDMGKAVGLVREKKVLILMTAVVVEITCFSVLQSYNGWDTVYYIGNMESALETNHFFFYDGFAGTKLEFLNLHEALSMFYVHFIVMGRIFHVNARIMAFYGMRALCVLLAAMIVYCFGRRLLRGDEKKAAYLVMAWLAFGFLEMVLHATSFFLFVRGYEAKGFAANVVIPAVLYAILGLIQDCSKRRRWVELGLAVFASVPISLTNLVVVPCAVAIMALVIMIQKRNIIPIFLRSLICVLPNIAFAMVYMLYLKGVIVIGVM